MAFVIAGSSIDVSTPGTIVGVDPDVNPFPDSAGAFQISSTSANDGLTDSGCRELRADVLVLKTSGDLVRVAEVIGMGGTTDVTAFGTVPDSLGVARIRLMRCVKVGDPDAEPSAPEGVITATIGGVPACRIKPGEGRSMQVVFSTASKRPEAITTARVRMSRPGGGQDPSQAQLWMRLRGAGWEKAGMPLMNPKEEMDVTFDFTPPLSLFAESDLRVTVLDTGGVNLDIFTTFVVQ